MNTKPVSPVPPLVDNQPEDLKNQKRKLNNRENDKPFREGIKDALYHMRFLNNQQEVKKVVGNIPDPVKRQSYIKELLSDAEKNNFKTIARLSTVNYLNDELKSTEEILKANQSKVIEKQPESTSLKEISDSELKKIFNASKVDDFRKLEQKLFNRNYLDVNRKWQKTAPELIALILCLQEQQYHYFKNVATNKKIKDFFQQQYQIDITQQFKPSKRVNSEKHKTTFTAIINDL
ncbi:MAG: hypothetical protein EPN39_14355 [Chitinophagaceae bacterium]|nr:MAG: hypothetical protein EPN39_14355 [Chitinophagaceae bacterium]